MKASCGMLTFPYSRIFALPFFCLSRSLRFRVPLRIFLPRVDQADDFDRVGCDPIDQDIVGVHDRFARPGHPTGAIHERMIGQPLGACFNLRLQILRGVHIALGDIFDDRYDIAAGGRKPDQVYSACRALALSMID